MCGTYNCDYVQHSTFRFNLLNRFSVKYIFPFPTFVFFTVKSTHVTQISVSQKMVLKKSKNPSSFFHKTIGLNNTFSLIENNFRFSC